MRLLPCGDRAVLAELDDLAAVVALAARLRADPLPGVLDVVPGARTVLVTVGGREPGLDAVRTWLRRHDPTAFGGAGMAPPRRRRVQPVELPVVYDGPDVEEVARLTGMSTAEVVAAHTGTPWQVAFSGFAPGFAYLAGGDPRLQVPRRAEPRPEVPAGSVGLAGEFSGVYPRSSPGGWQLLGRTDAVLWDPRRRPTGPARPRAGRALRRRHRADGVPASGGGAATLVVEHAGVRRGTGARCAWCRRAR